MLDRRGLREGFILTFSKMSSVTFSGAGPPFSQLYLIPKSSSMPPGLCEAERMKAPKACRCVLPLSALNHQAAENFPHATFPCNLSHASCVCASISRPLHDMPSVMDPDKAPPSHCDARCHPQVL